MPEFPEGRWNFRNFPLGKISLKTVGTFTRDRGGLLAPLVLAARTVPGIVGPCLCVKEPLGLILSILALILTLIVKDGGRYWLQDQELGG